MAKKSKKRPETEYCGGDAEDAAHNEHSTKEEILGGGAEVLDLSTPLFKTSKRSRSGAADENCVRVKDMSTGVIIHEPSALLHLEKKQHRKRKVTSGTDGGALGIEHGISSGSLEVLNFSSNPRKKRKRKRSHERDGTGQDIGGEHQNRGEGILNEFVVSVDAELSNPSIPLPKKRSRDLEVSRLSLNPVKDKKSNGSKDSSDARRSIGYKHAESLSNQMIVRSDLELPVPSVLSKKKSGYLKVRDLSVNPVKKKKRETNLVAGETVQSIDDRHNNIGEGASNRFIKSHEVVPNPGILPGKKSIGFEVPDLPSDSVNKKKSIGLEVPDLPSDSVDKKKRKGSLEGGDDGRNIDEKHDNAGKGVANGLISLTDSKFSDPDILPKKKKNKRNVEKTLNHDPAGNGQESRIVTHESELKRNLESSGLEGLNSLLDESKKQSKNKKKVRFQEVDEDKGESAKYISRQEHVDSDSAFILEQRNWKKDFARQDLRYGRFTKEEDEKIRVTVHDYIRMRGWGEDEGLELVLHSFRNDGARGCWLEIAKCLPYRPVKQIYSRAHRLFRKNSGNWSSEELQMLRDLCSEYGRDWKKIGELIGRPASLCKDRWRHARLLNPKRGPWAQDEYDKLCKLVRKNFKFKAMIPPRQFDRRQVRDDLNWEVIAEEMNRDCGLCATIWYSKLASPMIKEGRWSNADDHFFLKSLMESGFTSEEAVDWDKLLDHRDGRTCMDRWVEMTKVLGMHDHAPFEEKVEILAKRFTPDLLGIDED